MSKEEHLDIENEEDSGNVTSPEKAEKKNSEISLKNQEMMMVKIVIQQNITQCFTQLY